MTGLTSSTIIADQAAAVNGYQWLNEWEQSPMGPNYTESEVGWGEDD